MKKIIFYLLLRFGIVLLGVYIKANPEYIPIFVSALVIYLALEFIPLKKIKKTKKLHKTYPYFIVFGIGMMAIFWGIVSYYFLQNN